MAISEFDLIKRCFLDQGLGFSRSGIELGIGDDCALIRSQANLSLALSMDTLVAGVHFPIDAPPALIANRALAVNLSDLAAMAAQPVGFTLALTLPHSDVDWVEEFARGLLPLAKEFNCPLIGGDTTRGPLAITLQVHGEVDANLALRRDGARSGQLVCVTGTLGDAAAGLLLTGAPSHLAMDFDFAQQPSHDESEFFKKRYYAPRPQIAFARAAAQHLSAAIDLSDGLLGDLGHIMKASGVGARLNIQQLPLSDACRCCLSSEHAELAALAGGDDYELCVTLEPEELAVTQAIAESVGVQLTVIGEVQVGQELEALRGGEAAELSAAAYQHFTAGAQ